MVDQEAMLEQMEQYLKSTFAQASGNLNDDFDSDESFKELGIDSFHVLKIVKSLEEDFGNLPKTLLFENFNIAALAEYFVTQHGEVSEAILSKAGNLNGATSLPNSGTEIRHSAVHADVSETVTNQDHRLVKEAGINDLEEVSAQEKISGTENIGLTGQYSGEDESVARPIITFEKKALNDPDLGKTLRQLFDQYKNEGSVSRGTRSIAPNIFVGSERKAFFNYSRCKNIILVYSYTGPREYYSELVSEFLLHCKQIGLELNLFCVDELQSVGGTALSSTPFGVFQRVLNIKEFTLEGKRMRRLRYLVNKFEKEGDCRTEEYVNGTSKATDQDIANMIDRWCSARTMVNPLIHEVKQEILDGGLSRDHRLFLTYLGDVLQNVILISEMNKEESGYLMDLEFYPKEMPLGGLEFAISNIIQLLAAEGWNMFSLGGTYGCKLESSSNADPGIDAILDDLREKDIFNDEGNLQFKNKFRPENKTIYLCREKEGTNPDNVIDIIMMIADPEKMQTSDEENHTSLAFNPAPAHTKQNSPRKAAADKASSVQVANSPSANVSNSLRSQGAVTGSQTVRQAAGSLSFPYIKGNKRSESLSVNGFNPFNLADDLIEFDLKSDSWAKVSFPELQRYIDGLNARLQDQVSIKNALQSVFPFEYLHLTESGRTAEVAVCQSLPSKGIVVQNMMFPTWIVSQLQHDFDPKEFPHPDAFDTSANNLFRGGLHLDEVKDFIEKNQASIACVCVEVSNNAAGGYPVCLEQLRELKSLLLDYSIPLVMDGTRVLENAHFILESGASNGYTSTDTAEATADSQIWDIVKEIYQHADVLTASLAKDFGLSFGGIAATNNSEISKRISAAIEDNGVALDILDKKRVALALTNKKQIETLTRKRVDNVQMIWRVLSEYDVPVIRPAGGHCIIIDVKRIPEFSELMHPTASFIAWLYIATGIRAGEHSVGMQKGGPLNATVRIAIPAGLAQKTIESMIKSLVHAFSNKQNIPDLAPANDNFSLADINRHYGLQQYLRVNGELVSSDDGTQQQNNLAEEINPSTPTTKKTVSPNKVSAPTTASENKAKETETKANSLSVNTTEVAIVGLAGRYPQSENVNELWQHLLNGDDCVSEISAERLKLRGDDTFNASYRGGFLGAVDRFDSLFFNISPREAEVLDPQERLFLEVAWETLEDAGYYPESLPSNNVGVFVGAVWAMYQVCGVEQKFKGGETHPNSFLWSIANRVSYWMNFTGPSLTVDTACSSSLTALSLGFQSVASGDCDCAIVGGVNLDLHQHKYDINNAGGALSPDGVCRTFGEGANGYVAGEGVGAILLKPLHQAIEDKDNIHGIIKSVVTNHGGKTSGYTVPNPKAQANLVAKTLQLADVDPRTVGYIEAHGTGTELGDPIEINGLTSVFEKAKVKPGTCPVGSIKTNIGHLEAAAGIAGITKVLLQMKHATLVKSLHSRRLNPLIEFERAPFVVVQENTPWAPMKLEGREYPLRAGVSSFGAGGANAHVLLEKYVASDEIHSAKAQDSQANARSEKRVFPLSAKNEVQLKSMATRLKRFVLENDKRADEASDELLNNIAFTLQNGRKSFEHRLVVIADSISSLVQGLGRFIDGQSDRDVLSGHARNASGITKLLNKKEKRSFIQLLLESRDSHRLAELWIDGLLSDWQGYAIQDSGHRISLPTYPFADKRHWIGKPSTAANVSENKSLSAVTAIHPLIDSNESTFNRQLFKKTFSFEEFVICDHIVSDIATLPGVAYLDPVKKAGEIATGLSVSKIKNVLWMNPFTVEKGKTNSFFIELVPQEHAVAFEVFSDRVSDDGAPAKHVYAQGKLEFSDALESRDEYLDLDVIKSRCEFAIDGDRAYPMFKQLGLTYGPSFQLIKAVAKNKNEVIGELVLPSVRQHDFSDFALHPSVFDAAMQAGVAANLANNGSDLATSDTETSKPTMIVPYSLGEVTFYHPLVSPCFTYVTKVSDSSTKAAGLSKENIVITDESGKILARINDSIGVPLMDVHEKPKPQDAGGSSKPANSQSHTSSASADDQFQKLSYSLRWFEKTAVIDHEVSQGNAATVLLVSTNGQALKGLLPAFQEQAGSVTTLVLSASNSSVDLDENSSIDHHIDVTDAKAVQSLISEAFTGGTQSSICFVDDCFVNDNVDFNIELALENGPYVFFSLCKSIAEALAESRGITKASVSYLYRNSNKYNNAPAIAINGMIRSLAIEVPKVQVKAIELLVSDSEAGLSVGSDLNSLAAFSNRISTEVLNASYQDQSVRFDSEHRYIRQLQKQDLFAAASSDKKQNDLLMKQAGVVVITGGAGGLGLIFAEYLAQRYHAKLILTGRSETSEKHEKIVSLLKEKGASDVQYIAADVSNKQELGQLFSDIRKKYKEINGIIHSAGVLRDSYIRNKTLSDLKDVCGPKVLGTVYLDELTSQDPLDFFVTFSSLAALGGNAGQSDYAYANHFMDEYMRERDRLVAESARFGRSLSLNWSLWDEGGMKLDEQTEHFFRKNLGIKALATKVGISAFERALSQSETQLAILEGVQEKIEVAWGLREKPTAKQQAHTSDHPLNKGTAGGVSGSSTETESANITGGQADESLSVKVKDQIATLVEGMLKLDRADLDFDAILLDLGFDSIGLATFANQLNDIYKTDINPVLFFEHPSINAISAYLCSECEDLVLVAHPLSGSDRNGDGHSTGNSNAIEGQVASSARNAAAAKSTSSTAYSGFNLGKKWQHNSVQLESDSPRKDPVYDRQTRFIDEPIAIVGMAGTFPQSDNIDEFWQQLNDGVDMVSVIPQDRWNWEKYDGDPLKEKNKSYSKWGGFMKEVDKFDSFFFGITPREAEMMDPQQRILIETVWHAVENSGQRMSDLSGTKTGLFIGASSKDYIDVLAENELALDGYSASGNSHSILANRLSYLFNLRGPSAPLDTACSSSLVALHRAIESIHTGSSDMAIVGGVQVMLTPIAHVSLSSAGMLSKDGKCKTFDKDADGYVRGEGVGAIFIKKLKDAEAFGNPIHAVIKATAENHGGKVTMLTAPNPNAQADLLIDAYTKANIDPSTVGYIECHGTGTSLGDPIEINALKKAFSQLYKHYGIEKPVEQHCGLSSVKTNIGHLEPAAGMASLIKALMAIKHKSIPEMLHFNELNPYIELEQSPFYIVEKSNQWVAPTDALNQMLPRRAGVSSFGWGGANAHVVLEEYINPRIKQQQAGEAALNLQAYPIVLSAKDAERLQAYAARIAKYLRAQQTETTPIDIAAFAYSLQLGREEMPVRLAFMAGSVESIIQTLEAFVAGETSDPKISTNIDKDKKASSLSDAKNQSGVVNSLIEDSKWGDVIELWVNGAAVDWAKDLWQNSKLSRLALPGYPFARERHWIALKSDNASTVLTKNSKVRSFDKSETGGISRSLKQADKGSISRVHQSQQPVKTFTHSLSRSFVPPTNTTNTANSHANNSHTNPKPLASEAQSTFNSQQPSAPASTFSPVIQFFSEQWEDAGISERDLNHRYEDNAEQQYLLFVDDSIKQNLALTEGGANVRLVRKHQGFEVAHDSILADENSFAKVFDYVSTMNESPVHICFTWAKGCGNQGIHAIFKLLAAVYQSPIQIASITLVGVCHDDLASCWDMSWVGFERSLKLYLAKTPISIVLYESQTLAVDQLVRHINPGGVFKISENGLSRLGYRETTLPGLKDSTPIKHGGTYLITGGMGAIGYKFALHLARNYQVELVLLGRRTENQHIAEQCKSLVSAGARRVHYVACDISDAASLRDKIDLLEVNICGVLHAAGLESQTLFYEKTDKDLQSVLSPKIDGSVALDEALSSHRLDFMCYFSSSSAILGDFGACDYAIANRFQMTYAEHRKNSSSANGDTFVINWPLWQDGGMGLDDAQQTERYLKRTGQAALATEEGIAICLRILKSMTGQVLVVNGDSNKISSMLEKIYGKENSFASVKQHPTSNTKPSQSHGTVSARNKDISRLKSLLKQELLSLQEGGY